MREPAPLNQSQQIDLPMQQPADREGGAEANPGLRVGDERLIRRPHARHVDPALVEAEGGADRDCQNKGGQRTFHDPGEDAVNHRSPPA
ncbi:hypothetical protein ACVWZ6_008159 [Bradyrhizobium sp. GM6.1]